jgi:CDGSH-type Zn-finger protein
MAWSGILQRRGAENAEKAQRKHGWESTGVRPVGKWGGSAEKTEKRGRTGGFHAWVRGGVVGRGKRSFTGCPLGPARIARATIPGMTTKVTVLNNGPIRVEGDFEILDPTGAAFGLAGRTVISLCRCGQSANKPFCDGAHARSGFQDPVAARELPPPKPKV